MASELLADNLASSYNNELETLPRSLFGSAFLEMADLYELIKETNETILSQTLKDDYLFDHV